MIPVAQGNSVIDLVKGDNTVLWRSDLMTLAIDDNKRADLGHVMFTLP